MNNKIFLAVAALSLFIASCKKEYLETAPTDQVAQGDVFKTTTNAWAAVNGIHRMLYSQFYSNQDQGGQSANMMYMDVMGEDLILTTQSSSWLLNEYRWLSHRNVNSRVPYFNYLFYYTIIGNANLIIKGIDGATGEQSEKNAIKAQALSYRAWAYFQMVQLFGKRFVAGAANDGLGVPLVLEPKSTATPRATVAEVYTQINKDIDQAITLFATATARTNKSHLNINVAKGLKARIALTQQNWAVASQMAIEARTGFTLMASADYLKGFNNYDNSEWIWGVRQIQDQTTYFYSFFAFMSCNFNSTAVRTVPKAINSRLYNLISNTDIRKQVWDPTGTNVANFPVPTGGVRRPFMSRKFLAASEASSIGDLPLMRAAEMILIEAEAKARLGQNVPAAAALFTLVKQRDPNYVQSTATGAALITEIMNQRRIELWGEGFRFYDLKRTATALDRTGANHDAAIAGNILSVPATDPLQWEFVIPQSEINNSNGVVVQNPL